MSVDTLSPVFTVATLCYNHAPFLKDYFEGLLSQTYKNVQLIIHDDCSTDNSWAIIQSYEPILRQTFPEVICERSPNNIGMWASFLKVTASARVRGEFMSILEADDYYFSTRIERVVACFRDNPEICALHNRVVMLNQTNQHTTQYFPRELD